MTWRGSSKALTAGFEQLHQMPDMSELHKEQTPNRTPTHLRHFKRIPFSRTSLKSRMVPCGEKVWTGKFLPRESIGRAKNGRLNRKKKARIPTAASQHQRHNAPRFRPNGKIQKAFRSVPSFSADGVRVLRRSFMSHLIGSTELMWARRWHLKQPPPQRAKWAL